MLLETLVAVLFECAEPGIYLVTLNRPERLNAADTPTKVALGEIWRQAEEDDDVRVLILSGRGDKAFCAGSDLQEMRETGAMVSTQVLANALPGVGSPLGKPVIAALHGYTIGTGFSLAIHADLRVAAPNTQFIFPEVKHGMLSAFSAITLPGLVGEARALDIMLSARTIGAEEALAIGLVHSLAEDPLDQALLLARSLVASSPEALRLTKELLLAERHRRIAAHWPQVDRARNEVTQSAQCAATMAGAAGTGRAKA